MRPLIYEIETTHSPESLAAQLQTSATNSQSEIVLLRSNFFNSPQARYSFVAARPFLTFRSFGSKCEMTFGGSRHSSPVTHYSQFGNPWNLLDSLMSRYELLDEIDLPFPLGGCFGFWGYDLKNFVEPKLPRRTVNDLELPDCNVGFYDSLVVFDHRLGKNWIISTGLEADGSRDENKAKERLEFWQSRLQMDCNVEVGRVTPGAPGLEMFKCGAHGAEVRGPRPTFEGRDEVISNLSRAEFISKVERAQKYIRAGDIYQVNLSHRLTAANEISGWDFFQNLSEVSPAPYSAFLECGEFQVASSSPESFLRMSGAQIQTRPIKGTRPRSSDSARDAQLTYELQTSPKEMAELVMITDLLRNDLGKVCEFGSVQVPELVRLERFPQVQHLVSTVAGRLRNDVTHFAAFASCFPGGSITGAPKIRAMEIIDELEPITRGPYTGAIGYLGFNRESQLSITIRTAIKTENQIHFHVGAGIVADSIPEFEYDETLAKARGFFEALRIQSPDSVNSPQGSCRTR